MSMIYDLSNEYGARIISDTDSIPQVLEVESFSAGNPAIAISSTVSANPVRIDSLGLPATFRSTVTGAAGLLVSRTVNGSPTVAALRIAGTSSASAAVIGFGGGMISVTSILGIAATGAGLGFDYVLPVEVNGVQRGIPLTSLISLPGAAAF